MKRILFLLLSCMLGYASSFGATRYWVGPVNGNWNNPANWSATSGGPGGASVPATADAVILNVNAAINVDTSSTILSLMVDFASTVTFYTATPRVLTILGNMRVDLGCVLKDSTSANVPFNVVFNGATHATGNILGQWIFTGAVPVSGGGGATFTAQPGSKVSVINIAFGLVGFNRSGPAIVFRNNTGAVTSDASTLVFTYNTGYILDNNLDASIPDATWANDSITGPEYSGMLGASASTILVSSNMSQLKHLAVTPVYGNVILDLPALAADASFALPDNTRIRSNLTISNTNNHVLTLLANNNAAKRIMVRIGGDHYYIGSLFVNGNTTKVALATSNTAYPEMRYRMQLNNDFSQTGGTFYMQGNFDSPDSSTLAINDDLVQTGGTFVANNNAAGSAAPYIIEMSGPTFIPHPYGLTTQSQQINMKGTIIPANGIKTTLRVLQTLSNAPDPIRDTVNINLGVTLQTPLQTGRLELIKGTLNTSDTSVLTVTGTSAATAVVTGTTGESYVVGPLIRYTNSTDAYLFPTGRGLSFTSPSFTYYHPCQVVPASAAPSAYQATYFNTAYPGVSVTSPLKGVSTKEYWNILKVSGADASVQLTLRAAVPGATAADAIIMAHYIGGRWVPELGTSITPGTASSGTVMSGPLALLGAFTLGYVNAKQDSIVTLNCPKDTTIIARTLNCMAKVSWTVPNVMFPDTISIPHGLNLPAARLNYKGIFNGHGYYESNDEYGWPDARLAATTVGGHLITINSAAENDFVYTNINERFNYAWIGLYNTGTVGSFAWVTGEPVSFTNWIPGQPDNLYHDPIIVHEPFVHINGWADSLCRWNDNGINIKAKFIAEFDTPVLAYRQISGPNNGDSLKAGVYSVCYEKLNTASGKRDTCCFNITVTCGAITSDANAAGAIGSNLNDRQHAFSAVAFSNPSSTGFSVKINSDNATEKVSMQVADISGRMVERKNSIVPGSTVQFGNSYVPGVYFTRIMQGEKVIMIKLVKQ